MSVSSSGAVIVGAGASERMRGVDKVFAPLAGRPLVLHSLLAFEQCPEVERVVLVLAREALEQGQALVAEAGLRKVSAVVAGGDRRQDSVRLGLQALGDCGYVAVHDAARPLLTPDLVSDGLEAAQRTGAAVCAVPCRDTVKQAEGRRVQRTLDRGSLWLVQTPQVFRLGLLLWAHEQVSDDVTDDAAMVEMVGGDVALYEGSPLNIKVTVPEDLLLAEALLQLRARVA